MTSMVAKASSGTTSQLLPTLPVKEKGNSNKRKFRADPPLIDPDKTETLLPNEGSTFQFSTEKFEVTPSHGDPCDCNMCSSDDLSDNLKLNLGLPTPSQAREETGACDESHDADWSDLTESQLEELVLSILKTILKDAIKEVVDSGYNEDVATNAVLRSGLCHVFTVTASNIGENALNFLKNGQGNNRDVYFEDLTQMAKYILAELVCVLREVRPVYSAGDAMWCLLISDLNLSHACAMDVDFGNSVIPDSKTSEINSDLGNSVIPDGNISENRSNPAQVQMSSETKTSEAEIPNHCKPNPLTRCAPTCKCGRATVLRGPNSLKSKHPLDIGGLYMDKETSGSSIGKAHSHVREEKIGSSKKVSGITKKEYILRQKSIERSIRTYSCKGSSRTTKISAFGGLMLEKKPKSSADSSCVNIKNVSLKIRQTMGVDVCDKKTHNLLTKVGSPSPLNLNLEKGNTISTLSKTNVPSTPKVSNAPVLSAADTELSLSLPTYVEALNPPVGPPVPFEKKDKMILKLVPKVREMQNQLQEWTEWANQKIMQAARRLGKDKAELKMLKQEKEEVEMLKREKQTLEENTMKKLSEMENALYRASGQVEGANASLLRLEGENKILRQGMDAAKLRAAESAASCHEVSKREKKTMVQFQSWEKEKILLQEEFVAEKQKFAQLQKQMDRAIDLRNKLEAKWKLEKNTKEELLKQVASSRIQKHQIEALARSKEEMANSKAQSSLQKYKDGIEKLRSEISQWRLKSESSKIEALRKGVDGSYVGKPTDCKISKMPLKVKENERIGGVKRERECVMCLSEETFVVFLPCAHQVVCKTCNETHEKQGMKDCPSCRTPIQRRICIRYRRP